MGKKKDLECKVIPASKMFLMPPAEGLCQVCATKHEPHLPHNRDSLYYAVSFKMKHDREPTWKDAAEHCTDEVKAQWVYALRDMMDTTKDPTKREKIKKAIKEIWGGKEE